MNANTYQTVYENVQELRLALKEKLAELNDMKQNIYKHMDDEDLDAFTLGDHTFSKKKTPKCVWTKKALEAFAEDGKIHLQTYEEENTTDTVVYSSKKRKI